MANTCGKKRRTNGWNITDMLRSSVVIHFRHPVYPRRKQPFAFGGPAALPSVEKKV
jgi:hypothetical protein